LTEVDAGSTYCVRLGGTVTLVLHGAPDQLWRPVTLTGDALAARPAAEPPMAGLSAAYSAVKAGQAQMSSTRPGCPPAKPGGVSCHSVQGFQVTVIVQ
jgi:hypothetical protein